MTITEAELAALRADDVAAGAGRCRECGCTDNYGCMGGCWWVDRDLCSACGGQGTLFDEFLDELFDDDDENGDLVVIEDVDVGGLL